MQKKPDTFKKKSLHVIHGKKCSGNRTLIIKMHRNVICYEMHKIVQGIKSWPCLCTSTLYFYFSFVHLELADGFIQLTSGRFSLESQG